MRKFLYAAAMAATLIWIWPQDAWAVFQLVASPRRGGQSLRLQQADAEGRLRSDEITLSVITDRSAQYRILQTLYQPLTNETGQTMPAGSFIVHSPSNPLGTLRTQLETPVAMGQAQIYVSNPAGDADEFLLVYSLRPPADQPGGVYRTQITFTAEPVSGQEGVSPSITTLEVRAEVDAKFSVEVFSDKGLRSLDLGKVTEERPSAEGSLVFRITSNARGAFRIFQQLSEPMVSSDGHLLDEGAFLFAPGGAGQGSLSAAGSQSRVSSSQSFLYTSNQWGASDEFFVRYALTPEMTQRAGRYQGSLSFRVESGFAAPGQEIIHVPVVIEIKPIFSLETVFEQGGGISFGSFKGGGERQERRVILRVRSNLGQPYQISQIVPRVLSTDDGTPMAPGAFQFYVERPATGESRSPSFQAVKNGESALFLSDSHGSPDDIAVRYILEPAAQAKAGSYSSEIKYTITTL